MINSANIPHPLDQAKQELEEVLNSESFRRSERLSRFLRYLGSMALEGKSHQLNEYLLAVEVFDRGRDYSPAEDSIVRVQARELRRRLMEYYQIEKPRHSFQIELPKGSYALRFFHKQAEFLSDEGEIPPANRPLQPLLAEYSIYTELLDNTNEGIGVETLLVLSNPLVLIYAEGFKDSQAYISRNTIPVPTEMHEVLKEYSSTPLHESPNMQLHPTNHQNTGIGEAYCAFHVGRLMQMINRPVWLTQSRFLSWETTRQHHIILLGSPFMHPWTHKNFSLKGFLLRPFRIDNPNPSPGEPEIFTPTFDEDSGEIAEDYGLISVQTSPSRCRQIILAGITSPATQAVGEFFCDPVKMGKALATVKAAVQSQACPPDFQILLKTKIDENIPIETHYLTCRILEAE
jgi:hypothetical protein